MKSTGIVRKVDELGRVVIPIELRRTLGIGEKDALEIFIDDNQIILQKYQPETEKQEVIKALEALVSKDGVSHLEAADTIARAIKLIK